MAQNPKPAAREKKTTKATLVRTMLATPEGVTLAALAAATGWQAHSVRAALSLLVKAGIPVERRPKADGAPAARYRIAPPDITRPAVAPTSGDGA